MNIIYKALRSTKNKLFNKPSFFFEGNYNSWEEASKKCIGYDDNKIFEKVSSAILDVKNGLAAYERDSVLFYEKDYNYPLIAWVNKIASDNKELLNVVDWGGSLGSTYYQNKDILSSNINWSVIEQKHFVEFGKSNLEDDRLKFFYNLTEISNCNCVLFSAVLHYIFDYKELLNDVIKNKVEYIILERTPMYDEDRICRQVVTEPIYDASYVNYLFNEDKLSDLFINNGYVLCDSWESLVDGRIKLDGKEIVFKSFVYKKC